MAKPIKWLTLEEVKAYATTPKKALAISIKHWWQNRTATEIEAKHKASCHANICGLCLYYESNCPDCPVEPTCDDADGDTLWQRAVDTLGDLRLGNDTYSQWQAAATAMHKYLCTLKV